MNYLVINKTNKAMKKQARILILTLVGIVFLGSANAQVKIGDNPTTIDTSAKLEVESTTQGFLPPRMTTAQRNAIAGPAEGLTIYNTDNLCLEFFDDLAWYNLCDNIRITPPITGYSGAPTVCTTATISATPCSRVSGATVNDATGTTLGTEYDWTGATSSGMADISTTRALVDISGQCWMRYDMRTIPSNYSPSPTWVNSTDVGWSGYYTSGPFTNEGLLYQWKAAMNGATTERSQGVCPTGWHVPSDCEWMYLENNLGMSTADQGTTTYRSSGTVGSDLSTLTSSGNNNSSFSALLGGFRFTSGTFVYRGADGYWWSSSETSASNAFDRALSSSQTGVSRYSDNKAFGFSVRCLKD